MSRLYIETGHTARSSARTGIQTVVRGLLSGMAAQKVSVHPLRWSFKVDALTLLKPRWERHLGCLQNQPRFLPWQSLFDPGNWGLWAGSFGLSYKLPLHRHPSHRGCLRGGWLLLPELMEGVHVRRISRYARSRGLRVAGVFHDAIPWKHPELVRHWTKAQHRDYMLAFAELDLVLAVSDQAGRNFAAIVKGQGARVPALKVQGLAAEVLGVPRVRSLSPARAGLKILCVSTLEPRKNHSQVLAAFEAACARLKDIKMELHLVGAVYESAPEIADLVRTAVAGNARIHWHEHTDEPALWNHYRDCDFTVFASGIEGFGLPVMESLWFGKPCLCSDQGVMAENAAGGGCLSVETRDVSALTEGICRLATQEDLRMALGGEALARPLKTWEDFAAGVLADLKTP